MSKREKRTQKIFLIRYGYEKSFCMKCGEIGKVEFHHLDNNTKCFNPSRAKNFQEFFEETEKCIPLCKDCHKSLHKSFGGTKKQVTEQDSLKWIFG